MSGRGLANVLGIGLGAITRSPKDSLEANWRLALNASSKAVVAYSRIALNSPATPAYADVEGSLRCLSVLFAIRVIERSVLLRDPCSLAGTPCVSMSTGGYTNASRFLKYIDPVGATKERMDGRQRALDMKPAFLTLAWVRPLAAPPPNQVTLLRL